MIARFLPRTVREGLKNPDAVRRSNLLNTLLGGIGFLTIVAILVVILTRRSNVVVLASGITTLLVISLIYLVNRYLSLTLASWLFLISISLIFIISDTPEEVINGRTLFLFTIPIFMASVLIRPFAAFFMTGFITLILNLLSLQIGQGYIYISPLGLFGVAFVSWLSARSLEETLRELRLINRELDQRVETRTLALQSTNQKLQNEIKERKKVESELIVTRDRALKANMFKSELLARVSHELRTPLGAILGYLEMMRAGIYGQTNNKQQETINNLIGLNNDLTRLVNELLEQAQAESGRLQLYNKTFSPYTLFQSIYERISSLAHQKQVELILKIDQTLPKKLYGDEQRIGQIVVNLVGNAVKFTNEGTIELLVHTVDEHRWGFCVKDTGIGIPEAELNNIFDVFHQVDHTYTRERGGFGLGLSIVKQLIDMMNGTIAVESQLHHGTVFKVQLPKRIPHSI